MLHNPYVDALTTIEVCVADEGSLVSSEGEHREWDWDRNVDSNLASLDVVHVLASRRAYDTPIKIKLNKIQNRTAPYRMW